MPHWLQRIADYLPLVTDALLALGGIALAVFLDDLKNRRKTICDHLTNIGSDWLGCPVLLD